MVLKRRRRFGSFKKPTILSMPKRRVQKVRFRFPTIRIDLMNLLIILVLAFNVALIVFGIRQCTGRREAEPVSQRSLAVKSGAKSEEVQPEAKPVRVEQPENVPAQIEVLNGCGVPKIADKITSYLRNKGFDVVKTGNYENFNVPKTLVIDRKGNSKNAARLADVLGLKKTAVISEIHEMYMVDATVVLGKDFRTLSSWKKLERTGAKK